MPSTAFSGSTIMFSYSFSLFNSLRKAFKFSPLGFNTICADLFKCFANLYIPMLAPIQSISELLCPIIKILLDSFINPSNACAIILAFTFVLFSSSCVLPPKKVYLSPS